MIRDPLPTLRLCGDILQINDLSAQLLSPGRELDRSVDSLPGIRTHLHQIYHSLQRLSDGLARGPTIEWSTDGLISYSDEELRNLAQSCQCVCEQLFVAVNYLDLHYGTLNAFTSFHEALQVVWTKEQVETLEKGILACRRRTLRILTTLLRDGQSSMAQEIRHLQNQNRQIDMNRMQWLTDIFNTLGDIRCEATEAHMEGGLPGGTGIINADQFNSMAHRMTHVIQKTSKVAFVQRFLKTLHFRAIKDRHIRIDRAHEKTFMWIFETGINDTIHSPNSPGIIEWLRGQDGSMYWVAGKPASGKSTLMKYLLAHPQIQEILKSWAGRDKLVIASHFFLSAGSSMQRSKHGLLQSLLYGIFAHSPDLIPIVCQRRWEAVMRDEQGDSSWSVEELSRTLKTLINQTVNPAKFCFFIDGLDECTDDYSEVIELVKSFVRPNVKMCISSRPWEKFEDAYGEPTDRKLYLEAHNWVDIHTYVQMKLEQHPAWGTLAEINPQTQDLVTEIADRAQGVFLWAMLVVRSLSEWLTNGDNLPFLQKKLRRAPVDLEPLLKYSLESLDPIYTSYVGHIFKLALTTPEPLPVVPYASLAREFENENNALPQDTEPLTYRAVLLRVKQLRRQLNHMCKGLLIVYRQWNEEEDTRRYQVDFLHRTVRDFCLTDETLQDTRGIVPT
ncbi:hypothetical protein BDV26DRAFT_254646 [Aspergillus bertholletiae]|uniref:NACHT domain-containing protein n=1 Tax=Aspergillus bertholletiae TaxID=1226010 RepID=A0A5N7BJN9_9EURO|nr:hypothetical protein BDV26DRAFT_254646 [Aspergillus bertholletiae]